MCNRTAKIQQDLRGLASNHNREEHFCRACNLLNKKESKDEAILVSFAVVVAFTCSMFIGTTIGRSCQVYMQGGRGSMTKTWTKNSSAENLSTVQIDDKQVETKSTSSVDGHTTGQN